MTRQFFLANAVLLALSFSFWANASEMEIIAKGTKPVTGIEAPKASQNRRLYYFWATWCESCVEKLVKTLPEIKKNNPNWEILTISMDDETDRIEHFQKKYKVTLPILQDQSGQVRDQLKISAVPSWMIFKKSSDDTWQLENRGTGGTLPSFPQ